MKNKHIGSNFDDFLKEEGILEEIEEAVARKRDKEAPKRSFQKKGKNQISISL